MTPAAARRMLGSMLSTRPLSLLALVAGVLLSGATAAAEREPVALVKRALEAACPDAPEPQALSETLGAAGPVQSDSIAFREREVGQRWTVPLPGGDQLIVERIAPVGVLRRVTVDFARAHQDGPQPTLIAIANGECQIGGGRRLTYDGQGRREALIDLAPDLETERRRQPLNPPVPSVRHGPPDGPRVAIVDSGVNYTLPEVAQRLARSERGGLIGYDFWEDDHRPFDGNPARSPYFPQRHGTETASVLLREAPDAALVPYRYPRPRMALMGELVRHAANAGVTVMALPLGSRSEADWTAFAEAARAHPDMLFVVAAGNTGEKLDDHPIYPPVMEIDNMLVVTSSTADGRLAPGSSWSPVHVDLMVPAETVTVTDWRGRTRSAAGTSYAAPRLAALAARLQAQHRGWGAQELKQAILQRAQPAPDGQEVTKHGWIADPAAGLR